MLVPSKRGGTSALVDVDVSSTIPHPRSRASVTVVPGLYGRAPSTGGKKKKIEKGDDFGNGHDGARVAPKAFIFGGCGQYPSSTSVEKGGTSRTKGLETTSFSNEVFSIDTQGGEATDRFKPVTTKNPPCPRIHHATATDGVHLLVHGGVGEDGEVLGDLHALNVAIGETLGVEVGALPETPWLPLVHEGPPLYQHAMTCVPTRNTIVCVGGFLAKAPSALDEPATKRAARGQDAIFGTQDSIPNDAVYTLPLAPPEAEDLQALSKKRMKKFQPEWGVHETMNSPFSPRLGQVQRIPIPDCCCHMDSHLIVGTGPCTVFDVTLKSTSYFPELHILSLGTFIWTRLDLDLAPRAPPRPVPGEGFSIPPSVFPTTLTIEATSQTAHVVAVSVPEKKKEKPQGRKPRDHRSTTSQAESADPLEIYEDDGSEDDEVNEEAEFDFSRADYLYYKVPLGKALKELKATQQQNEDEHQDTLDRLEREGGAEEEPEYQPVTSIEVAFRSQACVEGIPAPRKWPVQFVMSGHLFVWGGEELASDHLERFQTICAERQADHDQQPASASAHRNPFGPEAADFTSGLSVNEEALLALLSTAADMTNEVPLAPDEDNDLEDGFEAHADGGGNLANSQDFRVKHNDGLVSVPEGISADLEALITESDQERRYFFNDAYSCRLPPIIQQRQDDKRRATTSLGGGISPNHSQTGSLTGSRLGGSLANSPSGRSSSSFSRGGGKKGTLGGKKSSREEGGSSSFRTVVYLPLFDPGKGSESARYLDHYANRKQEAKHPVLHSLNGGSRSSVPRVRPTRTYPLPSDVADSVAHRESKSGQDGGYVPPHLRQHHQFRKAEPDWDLYYGMPPKDQLAKKKKSRSQGHGEDLDAVEPMSEGEMVMHRRRVLSALLEDKLMVAKLRSDGESYDALHSIKAAEEGSSKGDARSTEQRRDARKSGGNNGRRGSTMSALTGSSVVGHRSGNSSSIGKGKKKDEVISQGTKLTPARKAALAKYEALLDDTIQEHLRAINDYSSQLRGDVENDVNEIMMEAAGRAKGLPPSEVHRLLELRRKEENDKRKRALMISEQRSRLSQNQSSKRQPLSSAAPPKGADSEPPTLSNSSISHRPLSAQSNRPMSASSLGATSQHSDTNSVPRSEKTKSSKRRQLEEAIRKQHEESVLAIQRAQRRKDARDQVAGLRLERAEKRRLEEEERTGEADVE